MGVCVSRSSVEDLCLGKDCRNGTERQSLFGNLDVKHVISAKNTD